jgi:HlyD family secretion protein
MSKKTIIIIILIMAAAAFLKTLFKEEKAEYETVFVSRTDIVREIKESGQAEKGEKISLAFEQGGRIKKVYVEAGSELEEGEMIAEIDTNELEVQLSEAGSGLAVNKAKLDKLLAGATEEEIQKSRTAVFNAETSLEASEQSLEDIEAQCEENLASAYQDALNEMEDAYLKAYNSEKTVYSVQRTYFIVNDQEGLEVKENGEKIKNGVSIIKENLEKAQSGSREEIDSALSETGENLSEIYESLKIIRENCDKGTYYNTVSSADKSSLDTHKSNIIASVTAVTNASQNISSEKINSQSSINTARASLESARGVLKKAEDELAFLTAFPRQEDIDLYRAQVSQAEAQVRLLENKIKQSRLRAPSKGQIIEIKKREGEIVSAASADSAVVFLPEAFLEIKSDIYEEDIMEIEIGDQVEISLVAFPKEIFEGRVIFINPAEKSVDGVIYYEVLIGSESLPEKAKPGMSADVVIKTEFRKNVLAVPEDALIEKDGKKTVKILKDGDIEEREIEIGLSGSNDMIEVTFGLKEGEKVILQ